VDAAGTPDLEVRALPRGDEPRILPVDTLPTDPYDEFLVHKTTTRRRYEEALQRFPDWPDVILWNQRGELTETCIANLVLEIDGQLLTPDHRSGLLAGTLREELLDRGQITEAMLTLDDLERADKIFTINSVRGWDQIAVSN
jgi:para-aminobenzoate synthetase/4-amino-4-deoxychorismate lyase